jgi:hypothetical protein
MKRWIFAAAAVAGLMMFPAAASANTCGDDGASVKLFDPQGYLFDFDHSESTAPDHNDTFGTFYDGGSNAPGDTPPGPDSRDDSYDSFGQLFVGGSDNSHMYWSADNNACTDPSSTEHDFPLVGLNGLLVRRKVFVNQSGLPGARILDLLSNPGSTPITTTVQFGDLTSGGNDDDLGSDGSTAVRASSSGDTVASPADFWAVTNDDPTTTSDATLAHIPDGQGGAVKANLFQIGGGADSAPQDNVAWGWTVTVPAHRTVSLMSVEVQQADPANDSPTEVTSAVNVANAYETAPQSALYQGMNPAEAATIANWPQPPVKKCKKHKKKHHGKKSAAAAKKHKKSKCGKKHKKHKK